MISCTGRYFGSVVDETGQFVFGSLAETGEYGNCIATASYVFSLSSEACSSTDVTFNVNRFISGIASSSIFMQVIYPPDTRVTSSVSNATFTFTNTTKTFTMTEV